MKLPGYDPILPEQSLPHVSKLKPVSFLQDKANKLRKKNTSFMTSKVKYGSLRLADFVIRLVVDLTFTYQMGKQSVKGKNLRKFKTQKTGL